MSLFSKKQTGDAGEEFCVQLLKRQGCQILCRNYRKPCGEIDIVAQKGDTLRFVEVKTRHSRSLTMPYEAVDYRKQQRLIKAAQYYLAENDVTCFCRFDVCEVVIDSKTLRPLDFHYIENAFETD